MWNSLTEGLGEIAGGWWLLGVLAVVGVAKGFRPLAKGGIKGYMAARDGAGRLASGVREGMTNLYEEAVRDYQGMTEPAPAQVTITGDASPSPEPRRRGRRAATPA
jgi:hypothetical protein